MDEETFEDLERRLWNNPDSLTDEELEQLVQICHEKENTNEKNSIAVLMLS